MAESIANAPLLNDRYRPVAVLARGGSSVVYRARDVMIGRDVAVKLFNAGAPADEDRYRSELRVLAGLTHHGVVSIVDAGVDVSSPEDPRPFIVMDLVPGEPLDKALGHRTLSSRQIGEIAYDIAEALEYVHLRRIVHHDITPSNIMLLNYGTRTSRERAQIADFGIALEMVDGRATVTGGGGTAAYVSPEQARGGEVNTPSDIYSLGLVLLECFTHELAYPGTRTESAMARLTQRPVIPATVPSYWRSLIFRMTHTNPADRPNAETVAAEARAIIINDELDQLG
jgi:serine/threonine protein kinase